METVTIKKKRGRRKLPEGMSNNFNIVVRCNTELFNKLREASGKGKLSKFIRKVLIEYFLLKETMKEGTLDGTEKENGTV